MGKILTFCSDYMGYKSNKKSDLFYNTDYKEKFELNLKSQPSNWEFRNTQIIYERNSFGHRSKELSEIDVNNYILCTGCSFTEGVGIPVETRYSDILSKILHSDVYNLGLASTGNDVIFYNLVSWFSKVKHKPKLVVIQWTGKQRFSIVKKKNFILPSGIWDEKSSDFILSGEILKYFDSKNYFFKDLIKKIIDVPIVEIFTDDSDHGKNTGISFNTEDNVDFARDLIHSGIKTHELLAKKIYDHINTKLTLL